MYGGATEATARMAYLPTNLARTRPTAIGRPIPGGSFSIEPVDDWPDDGTGELVYRGPNVMMGYAHTPPQDLALGARWRHCAPATSVAAAATGCTKSSAAEAVS